MNNPPFSVVIPVFNTEKYLHQCVDSVLTQSYDNFEVIMVNDGSTDSSPAICEKYLVTDKRVKVINKPNGGLSDARNLGLLNATGTYILFLDSDDYWDDPNFLEGLTRLLAEPAPDVIVFGYKKIFEDTGKIVDATPISKKTCINYRSKEEAFGFLSKENLYISSAWSKLVKRDLLLDNNITFEKGVTSEDIEWSAKVAIYSSSFLYLPSSIYAYRQRKGSITQTVKFPNVVMLQENIGKCIKLGEIIRGEKFFGPYLSYVAYQYITLLANLVNLSRKERAEIMPFVKENAFLLKFGLNRKVKIIRAMVFLCGLNGTLWLLKMLFHKRPTRGKA